MKYYKYIILLYILFMNPADINAVTYTGADTGADFLQFGIGARPSSMGESFVAVYSDVTATYWNPAGLAKLIRPEFGAMHSEALFDNSLEFFGFILPIYNIGVFGVSTIFFLNEPVPVTVSSEEAIGNLEWMDWSLTFSYGKKVKENFSIGAGLKMIQKRESDPIFGSATGTAYACDFGLIYEIPYLEDLNLGFAFLNIGNKIQMSGEKKKDDLPRTIKIGFAYNRDSLLVTGDLNRVIRDRFRISFGAEYRATEIFFLRAGYFEKAGNIRGVTYGLGVNLNKFSIDWANLPAGEIIGATRENRVSVIIRF